MDRSALQHGVRGADCKNATRSAPVSAVGPARGVLRSAPGPGRFHHARIAPPEALAGLVQHFWIVRWDLQGGPPQRRETLPHPNVHLVVEDGRATLYGIHRHRFVTELRDRGGVFGIKFRAGAVRPLLGRAVSTLRDRGVPVAEALGLDASVLIDELAAAGEDDAHAVAAAARFLDAPRPPPDPVAEQAAAMVARIEADRTLLRVEQAAAAFGLGVRRLQRLFDDYVGVGPKWVIQRYRMHEAIERLTGGEGVDLAQLAQELGYFDQAHFARAFRALVGRAPGDYLRRPP